MLFHAQASSPIVPIGGVFIPLWVFCAVGAVITVIVIREAILALYGRPVPGLGAPFYCALGVIIGLGAYLIQTGGI